MQESGRDITDGQAAPIQTSNTYVGLAQKTFIFASAEDANFWAMLQGSPSCKCFDNNGEQIASVDCTVTNNGTIAIINATFDTRVNTQGATGINNAYGFSFFDITGDMSPRGISIYH